MFHGGDGGWRQLLEAFETELEAEPTRVGRLASGLLLGWFHVGGEVATTLLSCTRGRSDTSCGTTFGGLWALLRTFTMGLMSLLETCDIPPLITRVDSDKMTHMVLPSTWIRLLRTYLVQFSLRLGANIQSTRAFWSQFFAREDTKAWADRHFF